MKVLLRLKSFFILVLIVATALFFTPTPANAQLAFGGMIVFMYYGCYEGNWIILGTPTPGSYMYTYGTLSYENGPPSHIGQWLLGMSAGFLTCTIQCGPSPCVIGGGPLILYHGSSI
jgi:hypothetical protein